jgi:hypothetical protein
VSARSSAAVQGEAAQCAGGAQGGVVDALLAGSGVVAVLPECGVLHTVEAAAGEHLAAARGRAGAEVDGGLAGQGDGAPDTYGAAALLLSLRVTPGALPVSDITWFITVSIFPLTLAVRSLSPAARVNRRETLSAFSLSSHSAHSSASCR